MLARATLASASLALALNAGAVDLPGTEAVVVTAPRTGAASEGEVSADELAHRPLARPAEVLEAVPGMVVTQHSGSGKANQYFLRGFNLDHGTDFAVHVDGMPVNLPSHAHGQGYADLNFLVPELLDHMHYRKGPYYADEGDFSAAGAAHLHLRRSLPPGFAQIAIGSYGYRRGLFGANRDLGGANLFGALELATTDGPWEHPERLRKVNAIARYASGSDRDGLSVTAMAYQSQWNATDQLPSRAVDSGQVGRFGAIDPSDGGETSRYSLSAQWAKSEGNVATRANAYLVRSRLDLFSNFTFFLDDPVNGDQFEQVDRRTVAGGGLSRTWNSQASGRRVQHTLGLQLRNDDIPEVALRQTVARQRIATVRNDAIRETSASLYYANETTWTSWLRSRAGLRGDRYRFSVAGVDSVNAGLLSPKLGLMLGPRSGIEYFANYGQGFHSNDARARETPLVRARGAELGLRGNPLPGWQSSLSLWRLDLDSELVFAGDAGTTEASHASRRQGIEWTNTVLGPGGVGAEAELTLARARFRDGGDAGPYIPGSMNATFSGGVTYERGPLKGGLRLRYFGPRALTEDNSQRSSSSTLVNAQLAYAARERVGLRFEVLNLFNRSVDDITYFYASRLPGEPAAGVEDKHFHPAEPRTLRLSLMLRM
jgi:outer membrane cobalamin receptor